MSANYAPQVQRVQAKLAWLKRNHPHMLDLGRTADPDWVRGFEEEHGLTLPEDYRTTITQIADGGLLPPFLYERYWRSLSVLAGRGTYLDQPWRPLSPEDLEGQGTDLSKLPGQFLLMGGKDLGWSLVLNGPYWGEVWTVGPFGAVRVPGCSFSQWLELVLDGTLGNYITFCLTGKEEPKAPLRRLLELFCRRPPQEENPAEKCQRWLDRNRKAVPKDTAAENPEKFTYRGPSRNGGEYMKSFLASALRPLPEECDLELAALRAAQRAPGWPWGRPRGEEGVTSQELKVQLSPGRVRWEDSGEMARLGQLTRRILAEGKEACAADLAPEDRLLFDQAVKLAAAKRFELRNAGARDLSFLAGLTHLKEVDLRRNDIQDLSPLASLTGLRTLEFPFNLVSDLSPLAGLTQLGSLRLYGNQVASLEPLRDMTRLSNLNLRGNPLEPGTLDCLRKCKKLSMLDLTYTGLRDLRELEGCPVHILDLNGNPDLTGLEVLASMKNLCCLYLDTAVDKLYDIRTIAPQLTEYGEMGGVTMYTWPDKYYN